MALKKSPENGSIVSAKERSCRFMKDLGNVFILGDSYSTFEGCNPEGYDVWYNNEKKDCNNVCRMEECWWYKFFSTSPAKLVRNCSYSGTTICNTGYNGEDCRHKSFIARLDRLIEKGFFIENKIDTMIIFGSTNDCWAGSPVGEQKLCDWTEKDLYCVYPAFSYMLARAKEALPEARIVFIMNYFLTPDFTVKFRESCAHFGVEFIELKEFQIGGGHPTVLGMSEINDQVVAYFENCGE